MARYKKVLAAVTEAPGTCRQIAERLGREEIGVSLELLALHKDGQLAREKRQEGIKGKTVFWYSLAAPAS